MEDTLILMRLREEISRALGNYYIDELRVLSDDYFIKIEGNFSSIDKVYTFLVKGDLLLNRENAERFLKSLKQMSIINQSRGYSEIKLVVSDMGKIVFAKDNKELSWSELDNYYRHVEMESIKSPLDLSLGLINLRRLYETYRDIYEQVISRIEYLRSYNSRLTGIADKKALIEEANKLSATWLRVAKPSEYEEVTLYDEPLDIKSFLVSGKNAFFSYSNVPLEHRMSYLRNLILSEHKMKLLIDKFTEELDKLEKIDENLVEIIRNIASKNILTLKEIDAIPEYEILDVDTLLNAGKLDDFQKRNILNEELYKTEEKENDSKWLEDIDKQQRALSREEKNALMLYKSFAYHVINQIISYVRDNNIDLNTIEYDENINAILLEGYKSYVESFDNKMKFPVFNRQEVSTIVEELFPDNYKVPFERYKSNILSSINPLLSSLSKTTLNEDMTVYRCIYLPVGQNIFSNNLGNALLSTTISNTIVSDFLNQRKASINYPYNKVIYKIELPAGSKVAVFTNDVFLRYGSYDVAFGDAQKEILLDSINYDFEYVDAKSYTEKNGENISIVYLKALPKKVLTEEENKFSM